MDAIVTTLTENGYLGMLIAAFIAGSFLPFSSEAVFALLLAAGLKPWPLLLAATVGNWAGSMFNYALGRMGKTEWIERYLHVSPHRMEQAQAFVRQRGAIMGFFTFLPIIGTAIAIVLGLMRADVRFTAVSVFVGKLMRYLIVMYSTNLLL